MQPHIYNVITTPLVIPTEDHFIAYILLIKFATFLKQMTDVNSRPVYRLYSPNEIEAFWGALKTQHLIQYHFFIPIFS
jgi:hypothetical protein